MSTVRPCSFFMRAHTPKRKKGAAFAEQPHIVQTAQKKAFPFFTDLFMPRPCLILFITPEQNS